MKGLSMLTNVPTDLLRTFVTVVDLGSYTRAGEALGRTQPAISPFPGTRARRVKEIRWMVKAREWHPEEFGLAFGIRS